MVEFLLHTLENTESDEVQSVLCVGLSKLMLSGMISDERVRAAFPFRAVGLLMTVCRCSRLSCSRSCS